jgi:PadR family transcriptional regulator, regulatory protein AphA
MSLPHAILGFLSIAPSTGYELKKTFDQTVRHFWSADQSQIYRTLRQLVTRKWTRTELIRQRERPNKKVYRITDEGRAEFLRWLRSPPAAEEPHVAPLLHVFFAGALGDGDVARMLAAASEQLRAELRGYEDFVAQLDADGMPSLSERDQFFWRATVEYGIAVTRAQKNWADALRKRLEAREAADAARSRSSGP